MSNPEQIRQDIERTRANLSQDVNALADEANPKNIAQNQVEKAKEGVAEKVGDVKERIFGREDDYYDNGVVGQAEFKAQELRDRAAIGADEARFRAADAAQGVRQNVADAPRQVRRTTRGNPLAAGLVAFGLGALAGGLVPSTKVEKRYVEQAKEQAQPYLDQAQDLAKDAAASLKEPALQAAEQVKQSAAESAQIVKDEADFVKQDVTEQAKSSKDEVAESAKQSAEQVKKA